MNEFEELVKIFNEFPGIGPRQARRFAYFVVSRDQNFSKKLSDTITNAKKTVEKCADCLRFTNKNASNLCKICSDLSRSSEALMVVSKDNDLTQIEKSGAWNGTYFVLGGLIPILEKEPEKRIRIEELITLIERKKSQGLKEIVFALNTTSEGENTLDYLKVRLGGFGLKLSTLGRGFSTGLEVEYADPETIKFALENKK